MLADDVTKVMDEQHMLEGQYGDLIAKRSELKGISKKPELLATKKEIAVSLQAHSQFWNCFEVGLCPFKFCGSYWLLFHV